MASNTIRSETPTPSPFVLPRYLTGGEARQILWEISKNMEQFLQAETVSAIGLGIFASLILLLALRSTSGLHRGKELRSNDLSHKIKALWTRPLITFFLIILLIIVCFLFALLLIISAAIFGSRCAYLVVLANTVVLVGIFLYSHIANIWTSVMEDDLIGKEEKGRKLQGVALMVIVAVSVINPARLFINKSGEGSGFWVSSIW